MAGRVRRTTRRLAAGAILAAGAAPAAGAQPLGVAADPTTNARISVTVSIGVAVLGQHGSNLFELLAAADLALYRAKDAGRNQVHLYAPRQQSAPGQGE